MTKLAEIAPILERQAIELPSWAFGNSGTRFKVFGTPGTPRVSAKSLWERCDQRFCGVTRRAG